MCPAGNHPDTSVSASECDPSRNCCQLNRCWDLFESARDHLGVRDDLFPQRPHSPSPDERRLNCITLRTFHNCINMTRNQGCLGNLNFHSALKGVATQMKNSNCSLRGPVYTPDPNNRPARRPCSYEGRPEHRECGLFGDPHLRTFTEEFYTCRVQGAWPLLNNEYLTVQVTNDPVGVHHPTATATSKVRTRAWLPLLIHEYRQVSNIRRTKYQHLKDSHTVLRLSLSNPLKPGVKSRMKM